jgi:hypothetical protein
MQIFYFEVALIVEVEILIKNKKLHGALGAYTRCGLRIAESGSTPGAP